MSSTDLRRPPRTSDGKPIFLQAKFPGSVDPYFTGVGDDATTIAAGALFQVADADYSGSPGDAEVVFSFRDWVYVGSGFVVHKGGVKGDWISIKARAPASVVAAGGASDVVLQDVGGFNAIVPSGSGTHEITSFVPVPAYDAEGNPNGAWDWDEPDTGKGAMTANAEGKGKYNLFDVQLDLVQWVAKVPVIGDSEIPFHAETKGRKMLPHWEYVVCVHRSGAHDLQVGWRLDTARRKTIGSI
jgi:hypothetical protein